MYEKNIALSDNFIIFDNVILLDYSVDIGVFNIFESVDNIKNEMRLRGSQVQNVRKIIACDSCKFRSGERF